MVDELRDEIKRKGFHLLSLIYVFGYWYLPKTAVICGLVIAIVIVVLFEYLRFKILRLNNFFKNNFKGFYRPEESDKISGLTGTLSGALLAILMFPNRYMVFASFLYFAFGDSVAAFAGKILGRHKTFAGKTMEGSLACFVVCFIAGLFIFNWQFALAGAFIAVIVEAIPWKISDNFWMQIIDAGVLTLLSYITSPVNYIR
ncbi:dolichol kinase [Endomicrobiia bacterium]|nr:dolichol kinase [Endomicrobiia bacterium]